MPSNPGLLERGNHNPVRKVMQIERLSRGPRRIGPETGFLSKALSSARIVPSGSITGTGLALLSVLGKVVWV
jgi:hypothetical protein